MNEALHIHNFPPELRRAIKAAAAIQGVSIKDWVVEAVKEKLNKKAHETSTDGEDIELEWSATEKNKS